MAYRLVSGGRGHADVGGARAEPASQAATVQAATLQAASNHPNGQSSISAGDGQGLVLGR